MATAKVPVFYSFYFDNDVMRVQLVRNIGAIEDNAPVTPNAWEEVKKKGDAAVEKWIDDNMKYRRCIVVLIGSATAGRKWITYEINKAWNDGKGVLGIHIHNLKCPNTGKCTKGSNPFDHVTFNESRKPLSTVVRTYDPNPSDAYGEISRNIDRWVADAIAQRK